MGVAERRGGERRAAMAVLPFDVMPDTFAVLPAEARQEADRLTFVQRWHRNYEEDIDSARLVARARAGDTGAFAALYIRYYERIYSWLAMALRSRQEAEDATQQVFTQALAALARFELKGPPVRAWLFQIARNHVLNVIRASTVKVEGERLLAVVALSPEQLVRRQEADQLHFSPDAGLLDPEPEGLLAQFAERLPSATFADLIATAVLSPSQREVLRMRFVEDLETEEIAMRLERTPEGVRQLQSRGLRMLKCQLDPLRMRDTTVRRQPMRIGLGYLPVLQARRFAIGSPRRQAAFAATRRPAAFAATASSRRWQR